MLSWQFFGESKKQNDEDESSAKIEKVMSAEEIAQVEENKRISQKLYNQNNGLEWIYTSSQDDMNQGVVKFAAVKSLNSFEFAAPYRGEQRAKLILREHPRFGTDVIVEIERGQFVCASYAGCKVDVVFGDGSVKKFRASEPEGYSTTKIFINDSNKFISQLKKVDKVLINVVFYEHGNKTLEFKADNLNW